jgi:hypothetical protein
LDWLFKDIFGRGKGMPVKGLETSQLFALGATLLYRLAPLYRHENQLEVGEGIKPLLQAARLACNVAVTYL